VRHSTANQFRAEIYFSSESDSIFKTDTKKMTVNFPQQVLSLIDNEYGKYLHAVKKVHTKSVKNNAELARKEISDIIKRMNNNVSTPTITTNKDDKPIDAVPSDVKAPVKTGKERKDHERNQNKKIDYELFENGIYAPFLDIKKMGIKKYVLRFNTDHVFYERFLDLDKDAKEFVVHFLHSMALTFYSELYDTYMNSGESKSRLIDEFLEKLSNFFKKDSDF
jgi:hypothetical protein